MKFKLRRYYLYYLVRVGAFIFYIIPLRIGLRISDIVGTMGFYILVKYRRRAIGNLNNIFGAEMTGKEIVGIAKSVFRNLARNAVELVNFPKINASNIDNFVSIRNRHIVDNALQAGKGVIVLTGHFGNWELLAMTFRIKNYKGAVMGRKVYFGKYDAYLNRLRKVHDLDVIYRDQSPKIMLKRLKDNEVIGMLADQDIDSVSGVFVNFLGCPAYTPIGPVALAKASGAALVPAFIVREGARHTLIVEEPIELADTGDKDKDMITNTQKWSNVVEAYIRRYPDHWVWMHRRWKTQKSETFV